MDNKDKNLDQHSHDCNCTDHHDHDHVHGEDCGCGEVNVLPLELEDGTKMDCMVLGVFDYDNKDYIALLPVEESDGDDVFIYEFIELPEEEEIELKVIEDEELFTNVAQEFEKLYMEEDN